MMCSSASAGESAPEEPPNLIPSLPIDLALNCLARVPRSYHPILRLVSKPIRSIVSSTLLYNTRSLINSTQHFLYLWVRFPWSSSVHLLTLNEKPNTQKYIFTTIPSFPSLLPTLGSAFAVVGHEIYVLGGSTNDVPSPHVWVLDCRLHTWKKAPNMTVSRKFALTGVTNEKIYVFGGCVATESNWAEVFDPKTQSWSPVCSDVEFRQKWMHSDANAVIGDKIYAMTNGDGVKYDPKNLSWESVKCELDIGWRGGGCVVNGLMYCFDYLGKIRAFDANKGVLRVLREQIGEEKKLPRFLGRATMANMGGNLVVVWEGNGENGNWYENGNGYGKEIGIWCAEIEVDEDENSLLWGKICWSGLVLTVPWRSSILNCVGVTL